MSSFPLNEEDLVFEYQLLKEPGNLIHWKRYLDVYIQQYKNLNSNDSKYKEDKRLLLSKIVWLYKRIISQFPKDVNSYFEFVSFLYNCCDSNTKLQRLMLHYMVETLIPKLLQNGKNDKKLQPFLLNLLNWTIATKDSYLIWKMLDYSLSLNSQFHSTVWKPVLSYVKENLNESILDNDMSLKFYTNVLRRYLIVCPKNLDQIIYWLELIYKTKDFEIIKEVYDQYLHFDNYNMLKRKISSLPFQLLENYMYTLHELSLDDQYLSMLENLTRDYSADDEHYFEIVELLSNQYIKLSNMKKFNDLLRSQLKTAKSLQYWIKIYNLYLTLLQNWLNDILTIESRTDSNDNINENIEIYKNLIIHKDLMLSDFKISQNPNLIDNWFQKINSIDKLSGISSIEKLTMKFEVYANAIETINESFTSLMPGDLGKLWCNYANLYWENNDFDSARTVYNTAIKVPFPFLKDLEDIWLNWSENEFSLSNGDPSLSIKILERALSVEGNPELLFEKFKENKSLNHDKKSLIPSQTVLFTSLKLWSFYLDLLESLYIDGCDSKTIESIIKAYERSITLKAATPLTFINYAHFLQKVNKIMESFQVYQRALSSFPPSTQYFIWSTYLNEVIEQTTELSNEHVRELFDQSLSTLKTNNINCTTIVCMYSNFEETKMHMYKRSVDIIFNTLNECDSSTSPFSLELKDKISLWDLAIEKTRKLLGTMSLRPIYEKCILSLPNSRVIPYIINFCKVEEELNEIYRAREILTFGSKLLPPSKNEDLWNYWDKFELNHGDKSTYKEMLKLKKTLEDEMVIDTEEITKDEDKVQFIQSSTKPIKDRDEKLNPDELELDL
ncbi:hypothetical protein Kpol_286p2 [Vanderwaltozyma polyspora DSM 70294]|uniref:Pre-mRNA-splicing factor Syf1/CRNKL1-like C-terminal HAT-repeats domain-containing protein n=1 Tax=Vanderwaltozyma polyspora (strain ATCC 22028 / DSM 70294 / BCRC 21397 / CBS 2163 / NBRC 10782 / NRRL Y-8283 / UCD 57-17) TaxID=436907 RepID=A7TT96_VANPO|nr:uncharacterized protein Kpol_286p2 [Vanderwaltozyma polyspora DSM 70294]EDO14509.1 hypothetical protein Kpol_286p2 [Vanderwaltozyma polyspora DSM 70294]